MTLTTVRGRRFDNNVVHSAVDKSWGRPSKLPLTSSFYRLETFKQEAIVHSRTAQYVHHPNLFSPTAVDSYTECTIPFGARMSRLTIAMAS